MKRCNDCGEKVDHYANEDAELCENCLAQYDDLEEEGE